MILDAYLARRYLVSFLVVAVVFVILVALIALIDEAGNFPDFSFAALLGVVLLRAPYSNYEVLPLVLLLASVSVFLRLARSSELVVLRASGRSGLRGLLAPGLVAFCIGVVAVSVLNPIVASTSRRYNDIEAAQAGGRNVLAVGADGIWLRQGNPNGQTVIHATRASSDVSTLYHVSFLTFDRSGAPNQRIVARRARLDGGAWKLWDVKLWNLADDDNPEAEAKNMANMSVPSDLTRDRIIDSFGHPRFIPIWQLPAFIHQLERAGFSARRYAMWFQMELARPLFLVSLMILAAAFTMRHVRLSHAGLSALFAILLGFGMYYVRNFARILGENGQIPITLAAWAPPVAAFLLGLGILLHMEDG